MSLWIQFSNSSILHAFWSGLIKAEHSATSICIGDKCENSKSLPSLPKNTLLFFLPIDWSWFDFVVRKIFLKKKNFLYYEVTKYSSINTISNKGCILKI